MFCLQSRLDSSFRRVSPWWSNIYFLISRASLSISSPRGRSHNMKSRRTSGSSRQTIWRRTSNKPSSRARSSICKRMEIFSETSHGCTLLLQAVRKDKGKPHGVRRVVFSQTVRTKPIDCHRYLQNSRATIPLLLQCMFLVTVAAKSDAHRSQSRCCLNDIDQRLSQNEVPLSHGHVVCILSVVCTIEPEARQSPKSKPMCICDLHVQHHFMAKPRREQFRSQSDAIAPLPETSQFLIVMRLGSGSIDHCSWLFSNGPASSS